MKRKGFTLIELLVVIAIIALLMGILMPALARVRALANRVVCGTNLKGIGTSIAVYSNDDFNSRYPRAGIENSRWGEANTVLDPLTGTLTLSSGISTTFYLLVREGYAQPDQFACKGDSEAVKFETQGRPYTDSADFYTIKPDGSYEWVHACSYSYHQPYYNRGEPDYMTDYSVGPGSDPGLALAGDPNPFQAGAAEIWTTLPSPQELKKDPAPFYVDPLADVRNKQAEQNGNTITHQKEGQNILFNDNHLKFEKYSFCGIDEDNVYAFWDASLTGVQPERLGLTDDEMVPRGREDSVLIQ